VTIPLFDFKQQQNSFGHCIEIDEAKVQIWYEHERIYLIIMLPMKSDGQELVMEYISDVTHRIQIDKFDMLEKAHSLSVTDELTGLYNRRYIRTALPAALDACSEHNAPLSFIFADLDYFKRANDLCGHAAGDQLLCEFASVLRQNLRKGMDWAVRYGGDEFLLCL
jgi:two-component system, cell cycle response regulator